jgi:hypothetical protein
MSPSRKSSHAVAPCEASPTRWPRLRSSRIILRARTFLASVLTAGRAAWDVLLAAGRVAADSPIRQLIDLLGRIDPGGAKRFPRAMAFIRPAFDQSELAFQTNTLESRGSLPYTARMLSARGVRVSRRRRLGCLGRVGQLVLFLVLGAVIVSAIDYVFAPWSFFLGGQRHLLPMWQGIGRMHADSSDYLLYVWFAPSPGGRTFNLPYFRGWGYLCTARGERWPLRLSASFDEHVGTDTNGKEMRVSMYHRPWNWNFVGRFDDHPRLELRGRWQNPDLVLDDGGSLSMSFLPDGTLYKGPARNQPRERQHVTVALHEAGWSGWWSDCRGGG